MLGILATYMLWLIPSGGIDLCCFDENNSSLTEVINARNSCYLYAVLMKIMLPELNWKLGAGNEFLLCGCFGDENVSSLAEIEVQFVLRIN